MRRAVAVGEIARRQLALDLTRRRPGGRGTPTDPVRPVGGPQRPPVPRRHHRRAAGSGTSTTSTSPSSTTRSGPGAAPPPTITVNPVIDLEPVRPRGPVHPARGHGRPGRAPGPALRVPLVHPPRRKCDKDHVLPYGQRRRDLRLQPRPALSAAPPAQDPRPVALPRPQTRDVPVDLARTATGTSSTKRAPRTSHPTTDPVSTRLQSDLLDPTNRPTKSRKLPRPTPRRRRGQRHVRGGRSALRLEGEADRVDAVAVTGGGAVAVGEDVAEVGAAAGAADLDPLHAGGGVLDVLDGVLIGW